LRSLTLIDVSGYVIIAAILLCLVAGVIVTVTLRARYAALSRDLARNASPRPTFEARVLKRIVANAKAAVQRQGSAVNSQALIDDAFQSELKGSLVAERFVRTSTGLMIILGLVGTFYGLTLAIGKLVSLVSGDITDAAAITDALTQGLTRTLTGMSVAFSTSLFGIVSAVVMTLLGVFANIADRRTAVMVQIEAFVDNVLLGSLQATAGGTDVSPATGSGNVPERLESMIDGFARSVDQLQETIGRFENALASFSSTTRDFREFNLHLKDNVQRMSLSFGDLSETLKDHVHALKARD
jgi:methyl-accepting chemotaxis protein